MAPDNIIEVKDLAIDFAARGATLRAVDGLSFDVKRGETFVLVGESGCGKSATSLAILGLLPQPAGRIASGEIRYRGDNLLDKSAAEMRALRGAAISMIFQDPLSSLSPAHTVGVQVAETLIVHHQMNRRDAFGRARDLLALARLPDPESLVHAFPHQLSGGMRQRVMIAMAIACQPALLIADEPTTALDVTIQAQILDLLRDLKARLGMSLLLITHDFGVVAEMADRVAVIYAGRKVEEASVFDLFARPMHPYTRALMAASPRLDLSDTESEPAPFAELRGAVPTMRRAAVGCSFAPRCPHAQTRCWIETPALTERRGDHAAACHFPGELHG
jgi:peptide/nickel transport system ATP-binding protein